MFYMNLEQEPCVTLEIELWSLGPLIGRSETKTLYKDPKEVHLDHIGPEGSDSYGQYLKVWLGSKVWGQGTNVITETVKTMYGSKRRSMV